MDTRKAKGDLIMKISVLMGSPRKKDGYAICKAVESNMNLNDQYTFDYIYLNDYAITSCKGCSLCFEKGEEFCPIKDDLPLVVEQLKKSDGIIFVAPVYACQIPGNFKMIIDRMAYLFHRPELIGIPAITLVTTAGGGIKPTQDYLKLVATGFGCNLVGKLSVMSSIFFEKNKYFNKKYSIKKSNEILKLSQRFSKSLINKQLPTPSYYDLYMFNGLKSKTLMSEVDKSYWNDKGWLNSKYYYATKLSLGKKLFCNLMNSLIKIIFNYYTKMASAQE